MSEKKGIFSGLFGKKEEEEARLLAKTLPEQGKWPCLFTTSDTTGEKETEEFFTPDETLDMHRFMNIGIIKNDALFDSDKLEQFTQEISSMKQRLSWNRSEILSLFYTLIPDFNHKETGKYLDGKM